jgi:hypothetical protein
MPSILRLPKRSDFRGFGSREEFEETGREALNLFRAMVRQAEVLPAPPDWAQHQPGICAFYVALPADVAKIPDAIDAAIASLLRQMIERGRIIERVARVETPGIWALWVDTSDAASG